ncbi:Lrp/AsnC family transcriptional regulator [Leucobacter chinensis]|uniref:Lrp/AsnC family transcriptional regulator n=1 Tax=Leucobacter chinensis TaxID=2851010 RepID=UPI001C230A7D|nr:Lrp/AsnC family transcriptional regulator [Leucobacter chinensis]
MTVLSWKGEALRVHEQTIDETDQLIAAALQINGRASWGEVARALELPERTVARRGQQLFDRGLVRVSTYVDVSRVLHARAVVLRVTTTPGDLWGVARELASKSIASSVSVLEGSNDVACMMLPRSEEAVRELLYSEIPEMSGITSINAVTVLKFFRSGHDWEPGILTSVQQQALKKTAAVDADLAGEISEEEDALIDLLLHDGRMPVAQLASQLGVSSATVRRRMESLTARGLMHPRTEVVPAVFGLRMEALVWFKAPMDKVEAFGQALAHASEIKFIVATTGASQLLANVIVADETALYEFVTGEQVTCHEGLEVLDMLVVLTPLLRGSLRVDEGPEASTGIVPVVRPSAGAIGS